MAIFTGESISCSPSDSISIKLSELFELLSFREGFLNFSFKFGIFNPFIFWHESSATIHFCILNWEVSPTLRFSDSDLDKSIGKEDFLLNQKCFLAYAAVNLSYRFFSNRIIKSFDDLLIRSHTSSSKLIYPLYIFYMVVLKYYD